MTKYDLDEKDYRKRIWFKKKYNNEGTYLEMIEKLAEAEKDYKLVVFIGAGVSISQGYPNWNGYVDHLIKYWQFNIQSLVHSKTITRETILLFDRIAKGDYSNKRKIDLVHQILKKLLKEDFLKNKLNFEKYYFNEVTSFNPENSILATLSNLNATFITPNYDKEIENHLKRKRKNVPVINDLGDFVSQNIDLKTNHVLHIHGTSEGNPDLLINSSAAYARQYLRERDNFNSLMKWFKENKPVVLFIGVSLEEDELLSLLFKGNSNFALMKADSGPNTNVDRSLRKNLEEFFYEENFTEIFWYGDDFDDLPFVVEDIVNSIKTKNKISRQQEYWNILTTLNTSRSEYVKVLNILLNTGEYHSSLNQLYDHINRNNELELVTSIIDSSFESDIFNKELTYIPSTFWSILDEKYDFLKKEQKENIKKLYLKQSFDPRNRAAYSVFCKQDFDEPYKSEIIRAIAGIDTVSRTSFAKNPDIMTKWLINQFSKERSDYNLYIKDEKDVIFNFSQNSIDSLHKALKNSKYNIGIFSPIYEMIRYGIVKVLYHAFLEDRVFYNDEPILENFPKKLLDIILIQKILVSLSSSKHLEPKLISRLIHKIDFENRSFGSELNSFVEQNSNVFDSSVSIPYRGKYIDSLVRLQGVHSQSFISIDDILNLNEIDLANKLIEEKDTFIDRPREGGNEIKTIEATENFIEQVLKEKSKLSSKLEKTILRYRYQLFERYHNLYRSIALDDHYDNELVNKTRSVFLENINLNSYNHDYDVFFDYLLSIDSEYFIEAKRKFLEFNFSNLSYYENIPLNIIDLDELMNQDLGIYMLRLLNLVLSSKVEFEIAQEIIKNIKNKKVREFSEGALYNYYNEFELKITKNTFLGYVYYHNNVDEKTMDIFKDAAKSFFDLGLIADNNARITFIIALFKIDPHGLKVKNLEHIDFSLMIDLIFEYEKQFPYELQWLEWLFQNDINGKALLEIYNILSSDDYSDSKVHYFLKNMNKYIDLSISKMSLTMCLFKIKDEKQKEKKTLMIELLFILLKKRRIDNNFYFAEDLYDLMDLLEKQDRKDLMKIDYVIESLTPYEKEQLESLL